MFFSSRKKKNIENYFRLTGKNLEDFKKKKMEKK